ncbi:hypothetical protein B0H13DRAFT_1927500 [Mycena leptocephala]|nr:hypothetical protein B0H13DRAFT_1927500 [Mycena leptocephala]
MTSGGTKAETNVAERRQRRADVPLPTAIDDKWNESGSNKRRCVMHFLPYEIVTRMPKRRSGLLIHINSIGNLVRRTTERGGWKGVVVTLVTSLLRLGARKFGRHLGSILAKARHFCGPASPPVMSYDGFSVFDIRRAAGAEVSLQSENLQNLRNEVSPTRAAEDDLQAAEKAFADAQAHLELKRAESKIDAHGSSNDLRRLKVCFLAPSNTSTSASDVTVAEETMPDTFLIILPDTSDS